jgi:hypothetical protein
MAQGELFAGLTLDDISVDEEGRVMITNPQIAERLRAAVPAARPRPNTNCGPQCNPACTPNTANCGCNNTPNCGCSR